MLTCVPLEKSSLSNQFITWKMEKLLSNEVEQRFCGLSLNHAQVRANLTLLEETADVIEIVSLCFLKRCYTSIRSGEIVN